MSFGITFGSIGDLIAVGQFAWSLAQSLSSTRGSVKEYQDLIKQLETFNNALLQVVALWQNYESSRELDELGEVTKNALEGWRDSLSEFRLKFEKKYGASLRHGGSGNWAKDTSKKFLWLKEKDEVEQLKQKIQSASDMITLFVLAAIGKSNKLDHVSQTRRIQAVHSSLKESVKLAEEQVSRLKRLGEKIDAQAQSSELIVRKVTSSISSLTQVKSIITDIKRLLELFGAQMLMAESTPRGLDTHWKQAPVTLEDALGNLIPIPLELVNSWDMFETILAKRFEKLKGHQKVLRKEYAIEESRSGRELNKMEDWNLCFRPGLKIEMSMIFKQTKASTSCPGCQTESESAGGSVTECKHCGMMFRRIEEVTELVQQPFQAASKPKTQSSSPKIEAIIPEVTEASAGDFKRVRLLLQKYQFGKDFLSKLLDRSKLNLKASNNGLAEAVLYETMPHLHTPEDWAQFLHSIGTSSDFTKSFFSMLNGAGLDDVTSQYEFNNLVTSMDDVALQYEFDNMVISMLEAFVNVLKAAAAGAAEQEA